MFGLKAPASLARCLVPSTKQRSSVCIKCLMKAKVVDVLYVIYSHPESVCCEYERDAVVDPAIAARFLLTFSLFHLQPSQQTTHTHTHSRSFSPPLRVVSVGHAVRLDGDRLMRQTSSVFRSPPTAVLPAPVGCPRCVSSWSCRCSAAARR